MSQNQPEPPEPAPRGTLVRRVATRVGVVTLLTVTVVAALGYGLTFQAFEAQELDRLEDYVAERGRTESRVFRTAEEEAAAFGRFFVEAYTGAPADFGDDFRRFFRRGVAGEWRTLPSLHEGTWTDDGEYFRHVSGFVSAVQDTLTPDLERRLVIALRLLARLAPATDPVMGLHASFPENAIVIADATPWGLTARADLDMTGQSVIGSTLQAANPERTPVWTNLYYDLTAEAWALTYQLPLDLDGRHVINPSNDVRLGDLLDRVLDRRLPGTHNMILDAEGALVAHPERLDEVQQQNGQIDLEELGDPVITDRHRMIREAGPIEEGVVTLVDDQSHGAYLAVTRFHGPSWWWVSVYPKDVIAARAHGAARLIVVLGILFFLLSMGAVYWFLRHMVARPIGTLTEASKVVGQGDYAAVADGLLHLPGDRDDEIGLLARTFRRMARSLRNTRELDDALFVTDHAGRILEANPAAGRLIGGSAHELVGRDLSRLGGPEDAARLQELYRELEPQHSLRLTLAVPRPENDVPVELSVRGFDTPDGFRCLVTARDITERIRREEERLEMERRMMEVQRYESLGRLAGGVAHDLNNTLVTIVGNASMARHEVPEDSDTGEMLDEITAAADRAAGLVRQMLAYAGKEITATRSVDLNEVCRDAAEIAATSVPDHVRLRLELAPDLPPVDGDPGQLHHVVTSLVINAREALGDEPGTVAVRTSLVAYETADLESAQASDDVAAGRYVTVEVSDTGPGFDEGDAPRLFEPFFSTKFSGRGLGLAAAAGVVRSHGGAVLADAEPGGGARFRVLLPWAGE